MGQSIEKKKSRQISIEAMRIIASFLVIVNHTNSRIFLERGPSITWFTSVTYFFICKIAVPLFLLIMGAVLLGRQDTPRKSVTRIARMIVILILFSFLYFLYNNRAGIGVLTWKDYANFIYKTFFVGNHITNAFWYLYLYIALLCLLPLMQSMSINFSKRQLMLLLFLSICICGTVPLISALTPVRLTVLTKYNIFFSPYIGLVFLGYYIERYVEITRPKVYMAALLFVALVAFQVFMTYRLYLKDPKNYLTLDNRVMITITGSAFAAYIIIKYVFSNITLPTGLQKGIQYLGSLTFGVYLLSDLMIDATSQLLTKFQTRIQVFPAMVLWEICIFTICAAITAVLRCIKPLRKLI